MLHTDILLIREMALDLLCDAMEQSPSITEAARRLGIARQRLNSLRGDFRLMIEAHQLKRADLGTMPVGFEVNFQSEEKTREVNEQ